MKRIARLVVILIGLLTAQAALGQQHPLDPLFDKLSDPNASVDEHNAASQKILQYSVALTKGPAEDVQKAIPVLLRRLEHGEPWAKLQASALISGLFYFRPNARWEWNGRIEELYPHLDDPNPRVRQNLTRTLALMKPSPLPSSSQPLLNRLNDDDVTVQGLAVLGLLRLSPPPQDAIAAIDAKLKETKDPHALSTLVASVGFSHTGNQTLISRVVDSLDSQDLLLIMAGVRAVTELGPEARQAVPRLRNLLEREGLSVEDKQMIRGAIKRISGE